MPTTTATMPREQRQFTRLLSAELRAARGSKKGRQLAGYAARFDSWSGDLGGFIEIIRPGAFADALSTSDVRALFNHDANQVLGRSSAGTLRLKEDGKGLHVEVDLPDTSWAGDLWTSIKRGDVSQMSFAFSIAPGGDRWWTEGNVKRREITKVKRLFDVSPVVFPAYESTQVAARALERRSGPAGMRVLSDTDGLRELLQRRRLALRAAGRTPARAEMRLELDLLEASL